MARFGRSLFSGRVFTDPATLRTMLARPRSERLADRSLGIIPIPLVGELCWGHSGLWGVLMVHCPQRATSIAVVINQADGAEERLLELARSLLADAPWNDR